MTRTKTTNKTVNAPAKINWALSITGIRENGYHELDMLMQEIDLHDTLTLTECDSLSLTVNGEPDPQADKNLIIKAVKALEARFGRSFPLKIELTKRIPSRAGLGGGSSDCAAVLQAVNEMYSLGLTRGELCAVGVRLGADVPFFIYGGLCRVKGIGEKIMPLKALKRVPLVIKHVGEGLSTPEVYGTYDRLTERRGDALDEALVSAIVSGEPGKAAHISRNDLETPAFSLDADVERELKVLSELPGAVYARMSGSGSAVYAAFDSEDSAERAASALSGAFVAHTCQ